MPETITRYGWQWDASLSDLEIEFQAIRNTGRWRDPRNKNGPVCGNGLFWHYKRAQQLLWPQGEDHHRWSDLMLQTILENRVTAILGARDCVSGDTRIFDPLTGQQPTIESLCETNTSPVVMTLFGPMRASVPFLKGISALYEILCDNGERFIATKRHFVASEDSFVPVEALRIGQSLLSYAPTRLPSNAALCSSILRQDDQSFWHTTLDFLSDYLACCDFCDEQLPVRLGTVQGIVPSHTDVPEHIPLCSHSDDLVCKAGHTHPCQSVCRLAISDYLHRRNLAQNPDQAQPNSRIPLRGGQKSQRLSQCLSTLRQRETSILPSQSFAGRRSGTEMLPRLSFQSVPFALGDLSPFLGDNPSDQLLYLDGQAHRTGHAFGSCNRHSLDSSLHYRVVTTKVQEIRYVGIGKYYDIHVPYANHYFAEGVIHHNSGKTHITSRYALTDYLVFPDETLILVSSTDLRGLSLRVWGDMKDLWQRAKELNDWLPGNPVDSKHGIFTDDVSEDTGIRDIRKGIICIPCLGSNGEWLGMEKFYGVKQKRRRLLGDEVSMMQQPYINTLANLDKGDFKAVFVGNPLGRGDPLDRFAEPLCGWNAHPEPKKTTTWKNKFGGITINLVGTDSPNYDVPAGTPSPYPYLVDREDEARVRLRYGVKSLQYASQIEGVRKAGMDLFRVLTRTTCEQYGAFKVATWKGSEITQIYALDAAFGGDRAEGGKIEFGVDVTNKQIIKCFEPEEIPIQIGIGKTAEEQLAEHVQKQCAMLGIPAANVFFDAGMYATLATAMSRIIGVAVNAVNFQGSATQRPMAADEYVVDKVTGARRLKRCDEAYSKFVTELWWSVRLIVESGQMREIPDSVVEEFSMREWTKVAGDRYEVESKKDMKERVGYSPDKADWLAIACEGARRKGFRIAKMVNEAAELQSSKWLEDMAHKAHQFQRKGELNFKA